MKKLIASFIILVTIIIIISSCNENSIRPAENQNKSYENSIGISCIDCGNDLGTYHNRMMNILVNNLPNFDSNSTKYDIINYVNNSIHNFLLDSLNYNLSTIDSIETLMITSNIINTAYPDDPTGYPLNVDWFSFSLNALRSYNDTINNIYLLTDREYNFIISAFHAIYENPIYETSDYLTTCSIMLNTISVYSQQWENIQWNTDEGILACFFLSQSKASTTLSRDYDYGTNPINYPNGPEVVAQVAADVGGAIVGGALGAGASYIATGKVNWGTVGGSAFVGAVNTTFPGLGGKLGSTLLGWASKLFK